MTTPDGSGPSPAASGDVTLSLGSARLPGRLAVPAAACGMVVFARGSGTGWQSPHTGMMSRRLHVATLATLAFDLLTPAEGAYRANLLDVGLLSGRLAGATAWLQEQPGLGRLPVGWLATGTGSAAALWAAAAPGCSTAAVVSYDGRPDLAGPHLGLVRIPTLLIVPALDPVALGLTEWTLERLGCLARAAIVPGVTRASAEPLALAQVARTSASWFLTHVRRAGTAG